jgi:hypothetical protein
MSDYLCDNCDEPIDEHTPVELVVCFGQMLQPEEPE